MKLSGRRYMKELFSMFAVFVKIGTVTFGGGLAMLPILERELAEKRKWTTHMDLMDYYAVSQVTPGIIAVNVATFLGYKRLGIVGGIVTTFGVVLPSLIIISLIAFSLDSIAHIGWIQKALTGINIAVAAMLTKIVWSFIKNSIKTPKNIFGIILVLSSFILVTVFNVDSAFIILGSAVCGLASWALMQLPLIKKTGITKSKTREPGETIPFSDKGDA
ncbi:MAG TPA: chromate transporter [Treponemataceae bacterium]|jgi:chromate transporter|nr:chromate transporter [Treponemataceae bacterium]